MDRADTTGDTIFFSETFLSEFSIFSCELRETILEFFVVEVFVCTNYDSSEDSHSSNGEKESNQYYFHINIVFFSSLLSTFIGFLDVFYEKNLFLYQHREHVR